jgi:hypothetical protein
MKRVISFTIAVCAVALIGGRAYADDAIDIEGYTPSQYSLYDNTFGYPYPQVTALASQPMTVPGGHVYTGWSILAQDQSGSLDLFLTAATLTTLTHNASATVSVNDQINTAGAFSPYHQIPELAYATIASSNHFYQTISTGNTPLATPVFTINQVNVATLPQNAAGYYLEIQNVAISGGGAMSTFFPTYGAGNVSYTITDATGSMVMYDWVTSYSWCGALGGTAVPPTNVNLYGFVTVYGFGATAAPEFVPIMATIPEPSTVTLLGAGTIMLLGSGLLGLLRIRRHRS